MGGSLTPGDGAGDGTNNTAIFVGVFVSVGVITILAIFVFVAMLVAAFYVRRKAMRRRSHTLVMMARLSNNDNEISI